MHISQKLRADKNTASTDQTSLDEGHDGLVAIRARRRKQRLLWSGVIGMAAVIAVAATLRATAPPAVDVQTIAPASIERVLAVTGRVRPQESVAVFARTSGQIISLTKDEGDLVEAGEVLGTVDPARAKAAVAQAQASVDAQARVVAQAERDLERARTLRAEGTTTQTAVEAATLAVTKGRDDLRRLDAALNEAKVQLGEQSIVAPMTGRILNRPLDPGQVTDTRTAIFTIAPTTAQDVEAEVDETYSMALRLNQEARLAFAGVSETVKGAVSYIAPEVQTSTGGRIVRLSFAPPAQTTGVELPVGLSVDVNVIVDKQQSALTVPRQAIRDLANAPHVLVVEDDKVARRNIEFIDWPAASVIVTSGLKGGDQVILTQKQFKPGDTVEIKDTADGKSKR
jgi:RND family efflux transporter MFP subunit